MVKSDMWPEFFPEECPPNSSREPNETVFRFVKHNPPSGRDFRSKQERNPKSGFGSKTCMACGLSVFGDVDDAKKAQHAIPGMKNKHIAKGRLETTDGMIEHTPARGGVSHHTWWKAPDLDATNRFTPISPPLTS
jgi:hypothetical protein